MNKKINYLNIPIDAITMQETLERVENAIVSAGTEIQHIKLAIHRVLNMSHIERLNMINEAFRYVKENHDWSINVKNYVELYKQLNK